MTEEPIVWVVFLPWKTSIEYARRFHLLPYRGTVYVYETPPAFVNADPKRVMEIFREITNDVEARLVGEAREINVLSYSAGNAFGFFTANNLPVQKFITVVTGYGLGEEVWGSRITQEVKRRSLALGYVSAEQYNAVIAERLPINQAERLPARTELWLGLLDVHIPISNGLKMLAKIRASNPLARCRFFLAGHIFTVFLFGVLNRWRRISLIYGG